MSLYAAHPTTGYMHADAADLEMKLKLGDGVLFAGDPDLELRMAIIERRKYGRPDGIVARRYEVWRHCEDGQERMIGHWRLEEFGQILQDVALMSAAARGRAPGVEERIDKANAEVEKAQTDQFVDAVGETLEHALRLHHDTENPRNIFRGIPGQRDKTSPASDGKADAPDQ